MRHRAVSQVIDVRALRSRLGKSQAEFALRFGFSIGPLRQWEQGRRFPDGSARILLAVIEKGPDVVKSALEEIDPMRSAAQAVLGR